MFGMCSASRSLEPAESIVREGLGEGLDHFEVSQASSISVAYGQPQYVVGTAATPVVFVRFVPEASRRTACTMAPPVQCSSPADVLQVRRLPVPGADADVFPVNRRPIYYCRFSASRFLKPLQPFNFVQR